MKFGKKFDRNDDNSSGGGDYIRNFKDGTTTVRFLEELDQWTGYWECYNPEARKGKGAFYPSPGKDSEYNTERVSRRFLVNVLVDGKVAVFKVPNSLMDRITRRSDKYETLTDRDYEITRSGKGLSTEYDIETGDRGRIDMGAYSDQLQDHDKLLSDAFIEAWGALPDDVDQDKETAAAAKAPESRKTETKSRDVPKEGGFDKDSEGNEVAPPSEPQQKKDGAAEGTDDETVLSEEQIRDMSRGELLDLAEQAGLEVDKDLSRAEIADFIINELTSD